jgi:hypothetical protein
MPAFTTCARHPSVETGLRCVTCEDAICPRCAVDAPVGMRCPSCARPDGGGGLRRRPDQLRAAIGVAALGAVLGGVVLGIFSEFIGFFTLIASWIVGLQIGQRVRTAAAGNTVDVVRYVGIAGAVGSVVVAQLFEGLAFDGGALNISIYTLLRVGIAGYGAWSALR